jgi:hypothetical protein
MLVFYSAIYAAVTRVILFYSIAFTGLGRRFGGGLGGWCVVGLITTSPPSLSPPQAMSVSDISVIAVN